MRPGEIITVVLVVVGLAIYDWPFINGMIGVIEAITALGSYVAQ